MNFLPRNNRFLAIVVRENLVQVGEFEPRPKNADAPGPMLVPSFIRFDSYPIEGKTESWEAALKAIFSRTKFTAKKAIVCVGSNYVFHRNVKLPPVDESKVMHILQYEAQQSIPFPLEDVGWDAGVLPTSDQGESSYLLMALNRGPLTNGIQSACKSARVKIVACDDTVNALAILATAPSIIIDVGDASTNVIFSTSGSFVADYSRSMPLGIATVKNNLDQTTPPQLRDGELVIASSRVATQIMAEISRTINYFKTQIRANLPATALIIGDKDYGLIVNIMAKWEADRKTQLMPLMLAPDEQGSVALWGAAQLYINNLTNPHPVNLLSNQTKTKKYDWAVGAREIVRLVGFVIIATLLSWGVCTLVGRAHQIETVRVTQESAARIVPLKDVLLGQRFLFEELTFTVVKRSPGSVTVLPWGGGNTQEFSDELRVKVSQ